MSEELVVGKVPFFLTCVVSCVSVGVCMFCAHVCVHESSLCVALSVVRIRVMRVMMCEAVVLCARATLRLTPHSQPNVFLILSIPHRQSASSDSNHIHMKLAQKHVHTHTHTLTHILFTWIHAYTVNRKCPHTPPDRLHIFRATSRYAHTHTLDFFSF